MKKKSLKSISDEAVHAKTGKVWKEWFTILDKAGARTMSHKEVVAVLHSNYHIGPWWQQMITVTYEQAMGRREKHEKPDGYSISISKTIPCSDKAAFTAFHDERFRKRWLINTLTIRKATLNKSMRITWEDGTNVEVNFYPKSETKAQVVVQHGKLSTATKAEAMKKFWRIKLEELSSTLTNK